MNTIIFAQCFNMIFYFLLDFATGQKTVAKMDDIIYHTQRMETAMKIFDEKFRKNKLRYILQCSLATISVFIFLMLLDALSDAVIVASLGASSFIAFAMPKTRSAIPKAMIGGYSVGLISGIICHYLLVFISNGNAVIPGNLLFAFFCALAIGLTIFVMAITNTEHPPSAGIALGIVIEGFEPLSVIVIIVGIILLAVIKTLLMPVLKSGSFGLSELQ